jgi:hypothetical protein
VKITDNYQAKYRLWAANVRVVSLSAGPQIPGFKSRRFASHAEMNQWKHSVLLEIARRLAK